jgi:type I restriction enzyme, S subunit
MVDSWSKSTIGDLCDEGQALIQTGPFGSQLHAHDYEPIGVPVVPTEAIGRRRLRTEGLPKVSTATAERLSRHKLKEGDILFARRGVQATGLSAIVEKEHEGWLCGTGAILLRLSSPDVDAEFLSFALSSEVSMAWLKSHAVGAVMPNLNEGVISRFPLLLPSIAEQQAIAHILGTLDDKIELNRRMNETLEAMARALFKSWFVDFDPVRAKAEKRQPAGMDTETAALFPSSFEESPLGLVPKGWSVKKFGEFTERIPVGKKFEQKTVQQTGKVPVLDQGKSGVIGFHNEGPGVVASSDSPVIVFANHTCYMRLVMFPFSAIQNVLPFIGKGVNTMWAFHATEGKIVFSEYKGHWPDFVIQEAAVPSNALTEIFARYVSPLLKARFNNEEQSRTLAALRDALLPKLLSGAIRVREADREVEQVA